MRNSFETYFDIKFWYWQKKSKFSNVFIKILFSFKEPIAVF